MELTQRERELVEALLNQGHITQRQKERVEKAVADGQDLFDALHKTPLIDSLALAKAQDYVRRSSGLVPKIPPPLADVEGSSPESMSRDHDGVNVFDWGEMEVSKSKRSEGAAPQGVQTSSPAVQEALNISASRLNNLESLTATLGEAADYDLDTDHGIGIVRRANELIRNGLDHNHGGMQLVRNNGQAALAYYSRSGERVLEETEDADITGKMIAHLKVSSRLSPWKTNVQSGALAVRMGNVARVIHVHSSKIEDADVLTLVFSE